MYRTDEELLRKLLFIIRKVYCYKSKVYRKLELPKRGLIMEADKLPKTLRNIYNRE